MRTKYISCLEFLSLILKSQRWRSRMVTPVANFASRFFFSSSSFCSFSCLLIFFSYIKHTSYITYILEWTFLYWSFRLWDVIRDFSRLFCSDIWAKSESNFSCQIWQKWVFVPLNQGDEGKCIIPATLNYPRWRRKIPWKVWQSQLVCNECFEPLTEGTVLVGPHYFKIDTSQITQMSDKSLLSYLNWKSRISGQTPIDRYCSNLLWVSNPHFALKSVDGVLLRKDLFLVYFWIQMVKKIHLIGPFSKFCCSPFSVVPHFQIWGTQIPWRGRCQHPR